MCIRFKPGVRLLCVTTLVLASASLLAACGSSSSTSSTTTSADQNTGIRSRAHRTTQAHPDPITDGVVKHRPQHGTGGAEINDDNPGHADVGNQAATGHNPCTLVSRAQAQAILSTAIDSPVEAPLGPTCIYRPAGGSSLITMTVESADFTTISTHIRHRTQLAVGGHTAYCGTYGQPTVFVPLASGRVLTITASCTVGTKFAATALPRLGA